MIQARLTEQTFDQAAKAIQQRHASQTPELVTTLQQRYDQAKPQVQVFPAAISPWDALCQLAFVHDPTDKQLRAVSQLTHTLQVVDSMERQGETDEELLVAAWLHDLGKLLLLGSEDPANIVCLNYVVAGEQRAGLAHCVCTWNHDDYAYQKIKGYVPERTEWLLRYHSLSLKQVEPYLNDQDRQRIRDWLLPFEEHDKRSKSLHHFPRLDLDKHRRMLERHLPKELIL
jgi:hypothetical protein